jgi:hypothetical protein
MLENATLVEHVLTSGGCEQLIADQQPLVAALTNIVCMNDDSHLVYFV